MNSGITLVAVIVSAAVTLLLVANVMGRSGKKPVASNAAGSQNKYKKIEVVITYPPRLIKLLALSPDQKTQLQSVINKFQREFTNVEEESDKAFFSLQRGIMSASFDDAAIKLHQGELVAAQAKRVKVRTEMLAEMRRILTAEQLTRLRPELPIERTDLQLIVQLPEGFSNIDLSHDQHLQIQAMIHSREPKMIALSHKEKAARIALEQAVFAEQFDQAAANQHEGELIAAISERVEVNTGILLEARKLLTAGQLKRLDEIPRDQ
jgi:Spy/CpxP family protein refolding chaperone